MIVKIPYTDGEHQSCARAPDIIVDRLKDVWAKPSFQVSEASIDNIPSARIYLGGDHTITYHTVKQFAKNNKNIGFIVFDAHPDVFQAFDRPSHQDYLKFLIDEGILDPSNVLVFGIRAPHPKELAYYRDKGVTFFSSNIFDIESQCDGMMEFLNRFDSVYLSIDMDAVDPAFAPGVSYIEPGGLTSREILYFSRRLSNLRNLKSIDIVELDPDRDVNGMTAKLAAYIAAEFL